MKLRRDLFDELQSEARRKWSEQNPSLPHGAPPPRSALVAQAEDLDVAWMRRLLATPQCDPQEPNGEAAVSWALSQFKRFLAEGTALPDILSRIAASDLPAFEEAVVEARRSRS